MIYDSPDDFKVAVQLNRTVQNILGDCVNRMHGNVIEVITLKGRVKYYGVDLASLVYALLNI